MNMTTTMIMTTIITMTIMSMIIARTITTIATMMKKTTTWTPAMTPWARFTTQHHIAVLHIPLDLQERLGMGLKTLVLAQMGMKPLKIPTTKRNGKSQLLVA